ncbi:MAG: biotin/lipoate--protein ligase family protein [Hyphomicrobium aestuarii]|nr:biotin/lipoate--protein ligase family protein [Hyphomicrobium aestuarii]
MKRAFEMTFSGSNDGRPGLDLPPGWRAIGLREREDAMAHAVTIAAEHGAATLVHVRRFDLVEFAVVLEPDEPLATARRAFYAVMNAAADAISAHVSPEKPVVFNWPATIHIDGGIVGGGLFAVPEGALEDAVPDWIVAGVTLRSIVPLKGGRDSPYDLTAVKGTSLEIEGVELLHGEQLIEGFCRHLMFYVDRWQEFGFGPVGETYLGRMAKEKTRRYAISETGDLKLKRLAGEEIVAVKSLSDALATPSWRDPDTGEPWL